MSSFTTSHRLRTPLSGRRSTSRGICRDGAQNPLGQLVDRRRTAGSARLIAGAAPAGVRRFLDDRLPARASGHCAVSSLAGALNTAAQAEVLLEALSSAATPEHSLTRGEIRPNAADSAPSAHLARAIGAALGPRAEMAANHSY